MVHNTIPGWRQDMDNGQDRGCMFSVDIVDVNIIWQSCLSGTSLTTDGGKNWKVIAKDVGGMASILAFADAKTGWVGSGIKSR